MTRGDSLKALGRHKDAIQCFDKALENNSDHTEVLIAKGDLRNALEIAPYNVAALISKGDSLGALGRHKDASRCFDKALEIYPDNVAALTGKGVEYEK